MAIPQDITVTSAADMPNDRALTKAVAFDILGKGVLVICILLCCCASLFTRCLSNLDSDLDCPLPGTLLVE